MRADRIGRTVGRAVAIALFGLTVTVAGIVGVNAAEPDDFVWDSVPTGGTQSSEGGTWGKIIETTSATASDFVWD